MVNLYSKGRNAVSSRLLRFSDRVKDKYLRAFALKGDGKILEIGCGPGTLLGAAPVVSES